MHISKKIKQILKWSALGFLVLLLLIGVLFQFVQTDLGKRYLARWLAVGLSGGPDAQVKIGRIEGFIPFDVQLEEVTISDRDGEWLRITGAALRWLPGPLLRGLIQIKELKVAAVHLDRLPGSSVGEEPKKTGWPPWPPPIPSFTLEQLAIDRLSLGEGLAGRPRVFEIRGRMNAGDPKSGLAGYLNIMSLEGPGAWADITWSLKGKDPILRIDARVEEREEGVLKTVLGFKETGPISIRLHGEGPIQKWKGELTAKADRLGEMKMAMGFNIQDGLRMTGDGHLKVTASFLPGVVTPLLRDKEIRFRLDVQNRGGQGLIIHGINLDTGWANFRLGGQVDLKGQVVNSDFNLGIHDISFLKGFVGTNVGGRLALQGRLSGPLQRPHMKLSITLKDPQVSDLRASRMECGFQLEPKGGLLSSFEGLLLQGEGRVDELKVIGNNIILPEEQFRWSITSQVTPEKSIKVSEFELKGQDMALKFSGQVDPEGPSLKGEAFFETGELSRLTAILGMKLTGGMNLHAILEGDGRTKTFSARIRGKATGLGQLPSFLNALVGREIEYMGRVELAESGRLTVHDLKAHSESAQVSGEAHIDLSTKETMARAHLLIPQISVFSKAKRGEFEGPMEMDVEMGGTLLSPKITAKATGRHLLMEGISCEQAVMTLYAENLLERPRGHFQLDLEKKKNHTISAKSDFALDNQELMLTNLSITAPGAEVNGKISLDLNGLTGDGVLYGKSDDLTTLSILWGERIGGHVSFKTEFSRDGTQQDMALELRGRGLESRFGHAGEVGLKGRFKDVFHTLGGKAEMHMNSYQRGEVELQTVTFGVEGQRMRANFSGSARGHYREIFKMETRGVLALSSEGDHIRVDQLQGSFGKWPLVLTRPMVIRRVTHDYRLEETELHLGEGSVHASGMFSPAAIEVDARLEGLPLKLLQLIGYPEFLGTATGRIKIEGRPDRPDANITLQIKEVRLKDTSIQNLPPANLAIDVRLRENRLYGECLLEGLSEKPVTANFQVPVTLSLSPLAFSLDSKGDLQGRVSAELGLNRIPTFFYLEGQSLDGRMSVDISMGGNLEAPEIKGGLRLWDGTYENVRSGTILRDLQILAKVVDDKLVLEKAQASDGAKGTLSAEGWLHVAPEKDFPFELRLYINDSVLVRRDDVTFTTNGSLTLSGSLKKEMLSGHLLVGPAQIQIPDRLPPEVVDLKVVEKNIPEEKAKPVQKLSHKPISSINLDLTIESPGRIFIRGRGLDSEWRGKLRISGGAHAPSITGALSVVRGQYNFFGKPFSLKKGTVAFDGNNPPSPTFDVTAEHRRSDMTARIEVSGNPSSPDFRMESDPPMPSDEILSRLLFGRSASSITPLQALSLAQALNAMSGGRSMFDIMDRTRKLLGVDQLDIKQADEKGGGTALSVGKYVREDVYMEVEKGVGTEGGKVSVEIELTPNITVETEAGADAQGGVGINWKWDY
ncbi:MAG: translocation/assembly module TamB domain-containing protein [Pseudomonadota bacterium]